MNSSLFDNSIQVHTYGGVILVPFDQCEMRARSSGSRKTEKNKKIT